MAASLRIMTAPLRATLLAALAVCGALGLPLLRALHAAEHARHETIVATSDALAELVDGHDETACALCQALSVADQPLALSPTALAAVAIVVGDTVVAAACAPLAPRHVPVYAEARAPPRG